MHTPDAVPHEDFHRQEATAAITGFVLSGKASLKALAEFYGIRMPGIEPRATLGEFVMQACDGKPRVGDQAAWGRVELTVREIGDNDVRKVSLRIVPLRDRRLPNGTGSSRGAMRRAQDRVPAGRYPSVPASPFGVPLVTGM